MKYEILKSHLESLQDVVNSAGGGIDVKDKYDIFVREYLSIKPNLYCLKGEEFKVAKYKMREHCYNETSKLVNILFNDDIKKRRLRWEHKRRKELEK